MATVIKPARSYAEEWTPNTLILDEAEIAVNAPLHKIWMRDNNFKMVEVGGLYHGRDLPRSDPAIVGKFWNNDGVLTVSAG